MYNLFVTYYFEFRIYESTNPRIYFTENVLFSFKGVAKCLFCVKINSFRNIFPWFKRKEKKKKFVDSKIRNSWKHVTNMLIEQTKLQVHKLFWFSAEMNDIHFSYGVSENVFISIYQTATYTMWTRLKKSIWKLSGEK